MRQVIPTPILWMSRHTDQFPDLTMSRDNAG